MKHKQVNQRRFRWYWGVLPCLLLLLVACGSSTGGGGSADPSLSDDGPEITGEVPSTGGKTGKSVGKSTAKGLTASASCKADTVIAVDSSGKEIRTKVKSDCTFSVKVEKGKFYRVKFESESRYVASLQFSNGSFYYSSYVYIATSTTIVACEGISFTGTAALADADIYAQIKHDHDGDGTIDLLEDDCDLDGIPDDWDPQAGCDEDGENGIFARILQVKPRHDPDGDDRVGLKQKVRARVNCEVDDTLVSTGTFLVEAADRLHIVDCDYKVTYDADKDESKVTCRHTDDPFKEDTFYTANIQGLLCKDGTLVETKEWKWLTEEEEEDEPDPDPAEEDPLELPDPDDLDLSLLDQLEEGVCDRTIEADFNDTLKVKKGQKCVIEADATVTGNIEVDGGVLKVKGGATIDGDISTERGAKVTIEDNAEVTGNLDLSVKAGDGAAALTVLDSTIRGNLTTSGKAEIELQRNTIDGNLDLANDFESCVDIGNTVGGTDNGC